MMMFDVVFDIFLCCRLFPFEKFFFLKNAPRLLRLLRDCRVSAGGGLSWGSSCLVPDYIKGLCNNEPRNDRRLRRRAHFSTEALAESPSVALL